MMMMMMMMMMMCTVIQSPLKKCQIYLHPPRSTENHEKVTTAARPTNEQEKHAAGGFPRCLL
jgi:hypothetical protein